MRHRGVAGADSTSRSDRIIPTTRFHVEQMKIEIFRLFLFSFSAFSAVLQAYVRKYNKNPHTTPMKTRIIVMHLILMYLG